MLCSPRISSPHAFTLVELIVMMGILAILGTIGFLSIGGYSSSARDSARVADTSNITKSLDLSMLTIGSYPTPDNSFAVTYSGGLVWNQGTVGSGVLTRINGTVSGGGITKKPVDPLKSSEYVYSSLAQGSAYQIMIWYEGTPSGLALRSDSPRLELGSPGETAYAAPGDPSTAYIRGNYGWTVVRTSTGGIICILAVPSIIVGTGATTGSSIDITSNTLSGALMFNGKSLRSRATSYNPNAPVYCGASLPSTSSEITTMMNGVQSAYSGSDIRGNTVISSLFASGASTLDMGTGIVTGQLGGKVVASTSSDTTPPTITSVTAAQASCNTIRFTVNGALDAGGLSTSAYSFDGGITWQALPYKDFTGIAYTLISGKVRVRDTAGNTYIHLTPVVGSSSACTVNCSFTTYQGSSCSASCGGGNLDIRYTKTVIESGGGTCPISEGQFVSYGGGSCNAQACAPTISVTRPTTNLLVWGLSDVSWSTTNATSVSWNCAGGLNQSWSPVDTASGRSDLVNGRQNNVVLQAAWIWGTSCTWTASGPGGISYAYDNFTISHPLPTISVTRPTNNMIVGNPGGTTFTTTNATSVRYDCTGPFNQSLVFPSVNGYNDQTIVQSAWVGSSTCIWQATWPGGTAYFTDSFTMSEPPPTIYVVRNSYYYTAGDTTTVFWGSTNATSMSFYCWGAYNGSSSIPLSGSNAGVLDASFIGFTICIWTATGPGGSVTAWDQFNVSP